MCIFEKYKKPNEHKKSNNNKKPKMVKLINDIIAMKFSLHCISQKVQKVQGERERRDDGINEIKIRCIHVKTALLQIHGNI